MSLFLLSLTVAFLPLLIPSGPGNSAPVDAFAIAYLVVALLGLYRQRRSLQVPAKAAWGLIVIGSGLALATSADPPLGLLTFGVDLYLLAILMVVSSDLDGRERALRTVLTVWSASALCWAVLLVGANLHLLHTGIEKILLGQTFRDRIASPSGNPNLAASYLAVSCFIVLASPWPARRIARAGAFAMLLWAVDVTGSNGALMGIAGGALFLALGWFLRGGRTPAQIMGIVGVAILVGVVAAGVGLRLVGVPQVGLRQIDTIAASEQTGPLANSVGRLNRSVRERLVLWESGWQNGGPRVLTGLGPGEAIDVVVNATGRHQGLHNDFIAYTIERGALGLVGLLALYLALFRWSGILLMAPGGRDSYRGLGAAMVASFVFSISHETLHFRHVVILFALLWVAAGVVAGRRRAIATGTAADDPGEPAGLTPLAPRQVTGAPPG